MKGADEQSAAENEEKLLDLLFLSLSHTLVSYGDTLPHTVVGVCGEFQRTGRFLQRGI